MACSICCEDFNLSTRKKIECPKCEGKFCSGCVKKYLLQEQEDICMSCRCEWTDDFLIANLTRKFMDTEYRQHYRKKLIDKEVALLPDAMGAAENEKNIMILQKKIILIEAEIRKLVLKKHDIQSEINVFRKLKRKTGNDILGKCPKEMCRGFIKNKNGHCGICETKVCTSCFEVLFLDDNIKKEEQSSTSHECKPENLETVKMLKKECKPCPKCASQIYKIDGCDQMFCTQCTTAFSWDTGKIESGRVHNPHYYEWLRTQSDGQEIPREPGDGEEDPCAQGQLIEWHRLQFIVKHKLLAHIHRDVVHQQEVVLPKLRETVDNFKLRVDYLLQRITRKEFEHEIERRDKMMRRKRDIYQCLEIFVNVMVDLFAKFYRDCPILFARKDKLNLLHTFYLNCKQILDFTNENLLRVAKKHKISCDKYLLLCFNETKERVSLYETFLQDVQEVNNNTS
jgi:hypothetical protein